MFTLLALCLSAAPMSHSPRAILAPKTILPARFQTIAPDPALAKYKVKVEPALTKAQILKLAQGKIKYVFVIYQENESFDHYFGTFPGADGVFSLPPNETPGFNQPIIGTDGKTKIIHPFRIDPKYYPQDPDDLGHAHPILVKKMDIQNGIPKMDQFSEVEERDHYKGDGNPTLKAVQYGELEMGYVNGDTIPFLWRYANRFVLGDHIFQTITGPSTPGNLTIFAGQTGATQWMLHPEDAYNYPGNKGRGVPVLIDASPFWGSALDPNDPKAMPYPHNGSKKPQINLTFANIAYILAGGEMGNIAKSDRDPSIDLKDTMDDVAYLTKKGSKQIPWRWFEEGFDKETPMVKSSDPITDQGAHASYVTHHNGPQYFGSVANNPAENKNLKGLTDFYNAIENHSLPAEGVFYVKGGYENIMGMKPANPDEKVQRRFLGDDDHPGYSDEQISEAMVARTINAIARSPYWKNCAIILTWDDCDGQFDHVKPPMLAKDPENTELNDGPRVPLILISPFGRTHYIMHDIGTQVSVIKFVDKLFDRTPLADLPDELKGRKIGEAKGLPNEGPQDDLTPDVCDLLDALDPARLDGKAKPLPSSYVIIPDKIVDVLPAVSGFGLAQLGIIPVDIAKGIVNDVPADFNPRPSTNPTVVSKKDSSSH